MNDVRVTSNLLAGGAYTVYVEPAATNAAVTGNRFSKWYWPWGGSASTSGPACILRTGGSAVVSGNIWDETGKVL
jgi:hypothetical protein